MKLSLRIVLHGPCLVALAFAAGCRLSTPLPLPDAAPADNLMLTAAPNPLVVRPGSSGRIRFVLRNQQGQPVPGQTVTFTLIQDPSGNGPDAARLSSQAGVTDASGAAAIEVLVGNLPNPTVASTITVQAFCQGSSASQADILVTTNAYSVEVLPQLADGLAGSTDITKTEIVLFDNTACSDLALWNLPAPAQRSRSVVVGNGESAVFSGVAGQGSSAIVGLGLDTNGAVQAGGCVDVRGSSLLDSYTIRVVLDLDHLFPIPIGNFQSTFDFQASPTTTAPPPALSALQSVWGEWARCPFDPARLWLDCTIDALAVDPTADPTDCVPVQGAEGALGDRLMQRRGTTVAPVSGIVPYDAVTPCRGPTDASGALSLESLVDALFTPSRNQLTGLSLASLPSEIDTLMGLVRVSSSLSITQGGDANSYLVTDSLDQVSFPQAVDPFTGLAIELSVRKLGLVVATQNGIKASMQNGRLVVPSHGFTLRLGSATDAAFEATSIRSRGSRDITTFVNAIAGLAQLDDNGRVLTGCAALDAKLSDTLGIDRGALLAPCQAGLDALAQKMLQAFQNVDGSDLDFFLNGGAQILDLDGDGKADAMGLPGSSGTLVDPSIWSGEIRARAGTYSIFGQWSAWRAVDTP